jgi:hypothetical protein
LRLLLLAFHGVVASIDVVQSAAVAEPFNETAETSCTNKRAANTEKALQNFILNDDDDDDVFVGTVGILTLWA